MQKKVKKLKSTLNDYLVNDLTNIILEYFDDRDVNKQIKENNEKYKKFVISFNAYKFRLLEDISVEDLCEETNYSYMSGCEHYTYDLYETTMKRVYPKCYELKMNEIDRLIKEKDFWPLLNRKGLFLDVLSKLKKNVWKVKY